MLNKNLEALSKEELKNKLGAVKNNLSKKEDCKLTDLVGMQSFCDMV